MQRPGFQVYPLPSSGSSGSGWQVGKPVVWVDDSLGFGRFVKLSAEREMASRNEAVFEEDDLGEGSEGDRAGEEEGSRDDEDGAEPGWTRTENLDLWKKKSILYVSTSRERWKRRHMQSQAAPALPSTNTQSDLPLPPGDPRAHQAPNSDVKKKDKYLLKEDAMILGYAMICYDVACLGWMNGVDLNSPGHGKGDEEVDWGRILNPLRVIWELVHSEDLGR